MVAMRFVVDTMLGKLARWMRILGYDTIYYHEIDENKILRGIREGRIFLTRNNKWKRLVPQDQLVFIGHNDPKNQIKEVMAGLNLRPDPDIILERCTICNQKLDDTPADEAEAKIPEYVLNRYKKFLRCPVCNRIYWGGTHREKMIEEINKLGLFL